jgi:hypothetical protein
MLDLPVHLCVCDDGLVHLDVVIITEFRNFYPVY